MQNPIASNEKIYGGNMLNFMDDNKYLMLIARILFGLVFIYFIVGIDLSEELFSGPIATDGKKEFLLL